jgi:hypothetical protein
VLIPDAPKARPDPEPKEKASLKPASLGVGLLAFEDPESSDTEQREQIADDKAAEQDQAGSESDSESPDSESDFDGDEDADESDEQDEYEAEA